MTHSEPSRTPPRRLATIFAAGLVIVAAAITVSGGRPMQASRASMAPSFGPASSTAPAASPIAVPRTEPPTPPVEATGAAPEGAIPLRPEHRSGLGEADGVLPDQVSVSDSHYPGVTNLDPDLLRALREAARRASKVGLELFVTSGWRSRAYQQQLFRQAVSEYGSATKAARWVAIPGTSVHESGNAVDLGPSDATAWLAKHGARYGLCQIYGNEPWHFELRTTAVDRSCPRMYADPTRDPRMKP